MINSAMNILESSLIDKAGPVGFDPTLGPCWFWRGRHNHKIYRFVWEVVNDQRQPEGLCLRHLCGNGHLGCMNPQHLKLGTTKENMADRQVMGRNNHARARGDRNGARLHPETHIRGEAHPLAVFTNEGIQEIRRLSKTRSRRSIAAQFRVSKTTINAIVNRKTWRHVP